MLACAPPERGALLAHRSHRSSPSATARRPPSSQSESTAVTMLPCPLHVTRLHVRKRCRFASRQSPPIPVVRWKIKTSLAFNYPPPGSQQCTRKSCYPYIEYIPLSIVRPACGLPAGFWGGPVRAGLSDDQDRPGGPNGRTALTQAGRRAPTGQR